MGAVFAYRFWSCDIRRSANGDDENSLGTVYMVVERK